MRGAAPMATEDQVRQALRQVLDPEIGKPIEDLGMLQGIRVDDGTVTVQILLTVAGCPLKDRIDRDVRGAVAPLEGVRHIEVLLGEMTGDQRQQMVTSLRGGAGPQQQQTFFTDGKTSVIAVASGKGGVGKSSVTVNLAAALAAEGHRVGVLDADVWGFSVPRMMGVSGQPVGFNNMILPLESHGVRIISMGFFVGEEQPVIWRGPMLHKAVQQFLGDVYWGEIDFLLCDLPPGTGDVSLSMASFLPGAYMVVVTTPQAAARRPHGPCRFRCSARSPSTRPCAREGTSGRRSCSPTPIRRRARRSSTPPAHWPDRRRRSWASPFSSRWRRVRAWPWLTGTAATTTP